MVFQSSCVNHLQISLIINEWEMFKTEFIYKQQILKMPDNWLKARDYQSLTREKVQVLLICQL